MASLSKALQRAPESTLDWLKTYPLNLFEAVQSRAGT